ncbi:MAG: hypothetical protein Q7K45_05480 [Nanoarchaeota archaeon]|nr:hypothetical protein [Nanoarchaeota archaeon]
MKKRKQKYHIQPQLQDQGVWMSAAAVFLLFFIAFISFSDHSSLTGAAVQNIAFMAAGSQFSAGVREIPGVEQYTIELTETVKNGQIVVTENPAIAFTQPFYSKFTISSDNPARMGAVQLFLKLEEQVLLSKGISQGDLRVVHNGKEIEIRLTKSEGRYLYYTATAPSIGDFVVGKAALVIVVPALVPEPAVVPDVPLAEEAVDVEPIPETAPLVGEAVQQPGQVTIGFWAKVRDFFGQFLG